MWLSSTTYISRHGFCLIECVWLGCAWSWGRFNRCHWVCRAGDRVLRAGGGTVGAGGGGGGHRVWGGPPGGAGGPQGWLAAHVVVVLPVFVLAEATAVACGVTATARLARLAATVPTALQSKQSTSQSRHQNATWAYVLFIKCLTINWRQVNSIHVFTLPTFSF